MDGNFTVEAQNIRSKEKKVRRRWQNRMFRENPKKLYKEIGKDTIKVDRPLEPVEVMEYRYTKPKHHNIEADWLKTQKDSDQ